MAAEDQLLREMAQHRGFRLVKSRRRKPGTGDYGKFGLADAKTGKECFGFGRNGLTASADEILSYLRSGAEATWKQSLGSARSQPAAAGGRRQKKPGARPDPPERRPSRAAAKADVKADAPKAGARADRAKPAGEPRTPEAKPKPDRKPKPAAEPEPELRIRQARAKDAADLVELLTGEGVPIDAGTIAESMAYLARAKAPVLVADRGGLVGCAAWHPIPSLHRPPIGRLTLLVVARAARRTGVGSALIEAVEADMKARGCSLVEAVAEIDFSGTRHFLRRAGFDRKTYRFAKSL